MSKKKKKTKIRSEPQTVWIPSDDAADILCPKGYTPLNRNPYIRRCVHKIADLVSNMTIYVMKNGERGDERLKDEFSRKLDIEPSEYMIKKNFVYRIVSDMLYFGNSVAIPEYEDTYLKNLKVLDGNGLTFSEKIGGGYVIGYKGIALNPESVLHFSYFVTNEHPYWGESAAGIVKNNIETLAQAETTKAAFMESKWKPSMIISLDSDVNDLEDEKTRHNILNSYVSDSERGRPWLIPANEMKIETVKPLTLNDLAINQSIEFDAKAVASCFNMPPFMLGVGDFDRDEYNFFVSTEIRSVAAIIAQVMTKQLVYSSDRYIKFSEKSLLVHTLSDKVNYTKNMLDSGMYTRNEGRNEFDLPPVDADGMDEYTILENYIPVSMSAFQKKLFAGGDNKNEE